MSYDKQELAKEMHDGLSQILTAASMNLSVLRKDIPLLSPDSQRIFIETYDLVNKAVVESRQIAQKLMK